MLLRKKKQPDANVTELIGEDEDKCDVLSVTDGSVDNKDRWIIDSGCSQHISSNRKMFSSYTLVQGGGGLHGEFYFEQSDWRKNNPVSVS